jgi:endoglucanase
MLAASWWHILRAPHLLSAPAATQTGSVLTRGPSVLPLVASAAAAKAAREKAASRKLMRSAVRTLHRRRSYYGSAWNALGQALLNTDLLGTCK